MSGFIPLKSYLVKDYIALTKPRLLFLVVVSSAAGFYLPALKSYDFILFVNLLVGTAFLGGGANALNQWAEREQDAKMERTKNRPLPAGKLGKEEGFLFGSVISVIGLIYLFTYVSKLTFLLGFFTWASYLFMYTPLKKRTSLNTWVGALTGALPPMMGWSASAGSITYEALPIFAVLYFWQLPHFYAIDWLYKEDYEKGGFKMLSQVDSEGHITGIHMLITTCVLFGVSLLPYLSLQAGTTYLIVALIMGALFFIPVIGFLKSHSKTSARRVFLYSIIYLPILLSIMIIDKSQLI